jgi:hypothetical protein
MNCEKKVAKREVKKINWPELAERILNGFKIAVFTVLMCIGLWAVYMFVWKALGFPCTNIARALMLLQALVSEYLFVKWSIK